MKNCKMFRVLSVFFMVVFLVFVCCAEGVLADRALDSVFDFCCAIEKQLENNENLVSPDMQILVENLENDWTKNESKLCFVVNHKSIEPMSVEIVKMKTYLAENDKTEFLVCLKQIEDYSETFRHFIGANLHNVL